MKVNKPYMNGMGLETITSHHLHQAFHLAPTSSACYTIWCPTCRTLMAFEITRPRRWRNPITKAFRLYPWKINMDHNHGGFWKINFLSKWVICRFHVNLPGDTAYVREVSPPANSRKFSVIWKTSILGTWNSWQFPSQSAAWNGRFAEGGIGSFFVHHPIGRKKYRKKYQVYSIPCLRLGVNPTIISPEHAESIDFVANSDH